MIYFNTIFSIFSIAFLIISSALGIEDFIERKILVLPLLIFDAALTIFIIFEGLYIVLPYLALSFVEFPWTRFRYNRKILGIFYLLFMIIPFFYFNQMTYSLSIGFLMIGIFHFQKGVGTGDTKYLDSITILTSLSASKIYLLEIIPPIIFVIMIGSVTGVLASPLYKKMAKNKPGTDIDKIPMIFHLWLGYLSVFILSLLL